MLYTAKDDISIEVEDYVPLDVMTKALEMIQKAEEAAAALLEGIKMNHIKMISIALDVRY